jgi:beta-glucosidase/6-phospho-beta-glucosidase/beta-galactosidase
MLNAHAAVVQLYRTKYQSTQQGSIGITLNTDFAYPLHPTDADAAAAQRYVVRNRLIGCYHSI